MASSEYAQCEAYLEQGVALDVAVFMSWFDARKEGAWLTEKDWNGDTPLLKALMYKAPEAVVMALFEAWPGAVKEQSNGGSIPLHIALWKGAPEAVAMALFEAWPDAVKEKSNGGDTPLHIALKKKASEAVAMALIAASPDAAKEKNKFGDIPLHLAVLYKAPEAVTMALIAAWPDAVKEKTNGGKTPLIYALIKKAPEAVVMAMIAAWPDAAKGKDYAGNTPLHLAAKFKAPEAVAMALIEAWPDAAKEKNDIGYTPLHLAAEYHASDAVVRALFASFQGAVKEVTKITTHRDSKQRTKGGGDTVLHTLAAAQCRSAAEARNSNIICFTLVEKRASLTATNALGQTPAEASRADKVPNDYGAMVDRKPNPHLIASFREIAAYKKRTHLSLVHFRDWTTVSHAWCMPSAKLVALTVMMVGETYKRGLLPRLPMDCWYFILNCIPRHELRQGGCEPAAEQAALAQYSAILREARARIDAAEAAATATAGATAAAAAGRE